MTQREFLLTAEMTVSNLMLATQPPEAIEEAAKDQLGRQMAQALWAEVAKGVPLLVSDPTWGQQANIRFDAEVLTCSLRIYKVGTDA